MFGMSLPVVKHSMIVRHAEDIPATIREAFEIAEEGRPGPVLVDLPKDTLQANMAFDSAEAGAAPTVTRADADSIEAAMSLIQAARRPVLYMGGGIALGEAVDAVRDFMARTGIPTVATLKAIGLRPPGRPELSRHAGHAWHPRRQSGRTGKRCADLLRRPV